jgi:hypothetical protein
MFSRDIVAILNCYTDRPWFALRKGKAVTEMWLAAQLRPYGVKPKTIWIGDESAKGYVESDLEEAYKRYLPRSMVMRFLEEARSAEKPQEPKASAEPDAGPIRGVLSPG